MNAKPLKRRMIVFSVPERKKLAGSILYQANERRGSLSGSEEVWILENGPECRLRIPRGSKCYISDGFELEPTDLDLWADYENDPIFKDLREFAQSVEGKIKTSLIHEESLLAIEE
jgi:hypothetical protein